MDYSAESSLLYAARNGDIETMKSLVTARKENKLSFDFNCTGMSEFIFAEVLFSMKFVWIM